MSRLAGLLRAAGGEISLFPSLGRWLQAVAEKLDGQEPSYVIACRYPNPQTIANLGTRTPIEFDTSSVSYGSDISFSPLTGEFRLLRPGFYELDARILFEGFDTVGTDIAGIYWEDSLGNDLAAGCSGISVPVTGGQNLSVQSSIKTFVRATSPMTVLVTSVGGQGGADVATGSFASVRRIAGL